MFLKLTKKALSLWCVGFLLAAQIPLAAQTADVQISAASAAKTASVEKYLDQTDGKTADARDFLLAERTRDKQTSETYRRGGFV